MTCPCGRFLLLLLPALLSAACTAHAEDAQGMDAGKEIMPKLVPIAFEKDRLELDRKKWDEKDPDEPTDPEEHKAWEKKKLAKLMGRDADSITDDMLETLGPHYLNRPGIESAFQEYVNASAGRARGGGSGSRGSHNYWYTSTEVLNGSGEVDSQTSFVKLQLEEKIGPQRILRVEDSQAFGLTLRLAGRVEDRSLVFIQMPKGAVTLVVSEGDKMLTFTAGSFAELLRKHPAETQVKFLRPLAEIGIAPPLHPLLPPVMAAALSGFSEGAAEHVSQADALIGKLADEDVAVRDESTGALIRLYPFVVRHIREAEAKTEDAETKMRLKKVIAAHPTIEKALEFVKEKKLHEDKAYLLDLLANVPFFGKSAQARLAVVYGKDYGEDASKWPKP